MSSLWWKEIEEIILQLISRSPKTSAKISAQICSGNLHPTENAFFFVELRGLKKIMTSPGLDLAKTVVEITGLRENFVRDGGIEEPYWGPSL